MKERRKVIIALGLIILIVWIIYAQIITPFQNKLRRLNLEIKKNQKIIKRMEEEILEREKLEKIFSSLAKKVKAKLPFQREESQFLTEIGKVAKETNVHMNLMNPLPQKDIGNFKELSVEIDMESNLGNLVRFLYQMRKSSVFLIADKLTLQPKSQRSALLKGKLTISTIFLKETQ